MDIAMVTNTIQLILAPVVIITACAIAVGGFWDHYAAISDRLRALTHERLKLLQKDAARAAAPAATHAYVAARLGEIGAQLPDLLRRLRLVRNAVVATYAGVGVLVLDMYVIALAVGTSSGPVAPLALGLFCSAPRGSSQGRCWPSSRCAPRTGRSKVRRCASPPSAPFKRQLNAPPRPYRTR